MASETTPIDTHIISVVQICERRHEIPIQLEEDLVLTAEMQAQIVQDVLSDDEWVKEPIVPIMDIRVGIRRIEPEEVEQDDSKE